MSHKRRLIALAIGIALAFCVMIARLAKLQIVDGDLYAREVADTRRRLEPVKAPRGKILDRKGRVLARDEPIYRLAVELEDFDPATEIPERIAYRWKPLAEAVARWRALEDQARREAAAGAGPDAPLAFWEAPTAKIAARFERLARTFPGLGVEGRTLTVSRGLLLQRARTIAGIARLTGLDEARLWEKVEGEARRALAIENPLDRRERLRTEFVIASPVPFDTVAWVEEEARDFPGVTVEVALERVYPYGAIGGPVVGYVGPLDAGEAARLRGEGRLLDWNFWRGKDLDGFLATRGGARFPDDRVGRAGVEASYDAVLAGTPGARVAERDRRTRTYEVLSEEPAIAGGDVVLSIDIELQRAVEEALDAAVHAGNGGEHGGALVLLDVRTGEVLALATSPRYDPNAIRRDYGDIAAARPSPLLDRAIAATLPPASTMKPLMAAAALEEVTLFHGTRFTPATAFHCRGYLHGPHVFKCDAVHGDVALEEAIAESCNVFFFILGEELGEARLAEWGARFGLGRRTGIDLPGEREGLFPTGEWKRRRFESAVERVAAGERNVARAAADVASVLLLPGGAAPVALFPAAAAEVGERADRLATAREWRRHAADDAVWKVGDSRNTAIGQGNVLATPIQMAVAAGVFATGGTRLTPHVARDLAAAPARERVALAPSTLAAIRTGMRAVVTRGTAKHSGLDAFRAAGKTGTAQAGKDGDQAWFMGFAPYESPEVAFACVVEHVRPGLAGGDVAAPAIARALAAVRAVPP